MTTLPPLRELIARYQLSARKGLGQHFLLDLNLTDKIARQAGDITATNVIEVGPGPGGLTRVLLNHKPLKLYAVEKDARCVEALGELQAIAEGRLTVLEQDALELNLLETVPAPRVIVANLPYNVATLLLLHWLDDLSRHGPESYSQMILMFQKEVADRITASVGSKAYGRLAIITQWLCEAKPLFDLPPSAFTPPPKVTSTVIRITPRPAPEKITKTSLEAVTGAGFGQRRKMLRQALKTLNCDTERLLNEAGIDPTSRAEQLNISEFVRLAKAYESLST